MVNILTIKKQNHPWIALLREKLPARADNKEYGLEKESAQAEGRLGNPHISGFQGLSVTIDTINAIVAGKYIPTLTEVSQLALACGLKPGREGYGEFNRLGGDYLGQFNPTRKPKQPKPTAPQTAPAEPPPEAAPPANLAEALKSIRQTRYYYPYGEYREHPVLTAAQHEALPLQQRKLAKKLSILEITSAGISYYPNYEAGSRSSSADTMNKIKLFLRCSDRNAPCLTQMSGLLPSTLRIPKHSYAFALKIT